MAGKVAFGQFISKSSGLLYFRTDKRLSNFFQEWWGLGVEVYRLSSVDGSQFSGKTCYPPIFSGAETPSVTFLDCK